MATDAIEAAIAFGMAVAGWLIPRRVSGTRSGFGVAAVLDVLPLLVIGMMLLIASARPLFAGLVLLGTGGAFALADQTKRDALQEPVVFSDMSELRQVFTHPHLYLPFAGPGLVIGGALALIALGIWFVAFTPAVWPPCPSAAVAGLALIWLIMGLVSRDPALRVTASAMRQLRPTGDPAADVARLGPFATLFVYGTIARAERAERRCVYPLLPRPDLGCCGPRSIVLVQCESFFDARRMPLQFPSDLLPAYQACLDRGAMHGRLEVPAWGANTTRTEFAVLTGIPCSQLGYDRFNPYHAFAREPIASLAFCLRTEGYRTVCLHPYDGDFFRRDLTLPALGFETFLARDIIGGSRRKPYYSDPDLARAALQILENDSVPTFLFVITMGNHGPWLDDRTGVEPALRGLSDVRGVPQGRALLRYLDGLTRSDQMLGILAEHAWRNRDDMLLCFYGDHLPSLPKAFAHFGFAERASDYILLDGIDRRSCRIDLPADRLTWLMLDRLRAHGAVRANL